MCQGIIDAEPDASKDNLGLCHINNRRMDAVSAPALDGCCGCEVSGFLKSSYKFSPAVGIAAVVGGVDTNENIESPQILGPGKCVTQKYCVAGGYISWWDLT